MAHDHEAPRYREAAYQALDQLDWCVEYLRTIRKTKISKQVAKNRSAIARTLARLEEGPDSRPRREGV